MQLDQTNKKPVFIIVLLLFLLSAISAGYTLYKYKTGVAKHDADGKTAQINKVPFPYINTGTLPPAKAGEEYRSEIFATLTNANSDLPITIIGLPEGLTLGSCSQRFNVNLTPVPNTQAMCMIIGTPTKEGTYQIKASVTILTKDGYTIVEQMIDLVVAAP